MIHDVQEIPEAIFNGLVWRLRTDVLQLDFGKNQIYQIFGADLPRCKFLLVTQTSFAKKEFLPSCLFAMWILRGTSWAQIRLPIPLMILIYAL